MRFLKIFAALLGILLIAVVAGGVFIAYFFDPNDYKEYARTWVEERTGRSFAIDGDVTLSFYPWLAIETGRVALGNAEGFGSTPFAAAERVSARVRLLPLLQRQIEIGTVQIDGLELDLASTTDGTTNWDDLLQLGTDSQDSGEVSSSSDAADAASLDIEAVALRGARVVWRDGSDTPSYIISDISLQTGTINPGAPIELSLSFSGLDVIRQLNAQIALDTTMTLDESGSVSTTQSTLDWQLRNGAGNEQGNGRAQIASLSFIPGESVTTGAVTMSNNIVEQPFGNGALAAELSWSALTADLATLSVNVSNLATEANGIRAQWQLVGENLNQDAASMRGSIVVEDSPAAALFELLGYAWPEELSAAELGNLNGSTTFAIAFDTQDIELSNTSVTMLGINARIDNAALRGERVSANFDVTPFRPNNSIRKLISAYLPEEMDPGAIGRIALKGSLAGSFNDATVNNLQAELLGTTLTGNLRFVDTGSAMAISGTLESSRFTANELIAMAGSLVPDGISPETAGNLLIATTFNYDTGRGTARLDPIRLEAFGISAGGSVNAQSLASNPEFSGRINIPNLNPRDLLGRFDLPVPQTSDDAVLRRAAINTQFEISATSGSFDGLVINLDDSRIAGSFSVQNFSDPLYRFALQADTLDVDRYLPPQAPPAADDSAAPADDERRAGDIELSNEALSSINVEGQAIVGSLHLAGMDFQNVRTGIAVGNGRMNLDSAHADLYGGTFDGNFRVNAASDVPSLQLQGTVRSLQLTPLITALAGSANFSGTGSFDIDLQGRGPTITDNLRSAAGTMGFELTNGGIDGFNVDKTLCRAFNRLRGNPAPANPVDRTPYTLIRGTATVRDGIASSSDLYAQAGSVEVRGRGTLALADQVTDYAFDARLARSIPVQGCGEMDRIIGEDFPLVMKGPATAPSIQPDYGEVVKRVIEDRIRDNLQERLLDRILR